MTEHISTFGKTIHLSSIRSVFLVRCDVSVQAGSNNFHVEKYPTIAMLVDLRVHLYSFMSLSGITAAYKADLLFWERFQRVEALQGCEHVLTSMPMEMRRH